MLSFKTFAVFFVFFLKSLVSLFFVKVVEPEAAGFESVSPAHRPAHCHLSEDHQNSQGEGIRPGARGGRGWVSKTEAGITHL